MNKEDNFTKGGKKVLRAFSCEDCGDTKHWWRKKPTLKRLKEFTDNRQWCWKCQKITQHVETTTVTTSQK